MRIRAARTEDAGEITAVIEEAFEDDARVARLWNDVAARGLDRASLVATEGPGVVGHVGLSHGWLDARRELVDVLLLSPLSVRPAHRRRGIGGALVRAAVAAAADLSAPLLFLEGSPEFYGRLGFERAGLHGLEAPSRRSPGRAVQVALLAAYQPWMTGRIVYRDVWWEHDCAGLRDPDLARLERALGTDS